VIVTTGEKIVRFRDWMEPAHPMITKLHDDLLAIYKLIREKYQVNIDKAFDSVSRQIGFVVATSLPVRIEIGDKGVVKQLSMGSENLKGTLFERELSAATEGLKKEKLATVGPGTFNLYLVWFSALKLKLRADWMEPAHFRKLVMDRRITATAGIKPIPEPQEPAHWFDPGALISAEDAVLISVIDEIYPELRLADTVASYRTELARVMPEVKEPAHFRRASPDDVLQAIRKLLDETQR
jgi:hypothetical protein